MLVNVEPSRDLKGCTQPPVNTGLSEVHIILFVLILAYHFRVEDEAVLDRGASFVKHVCDEEEVEGEVLLRA